jgi:hypothetical protein
VDFETSGPLTLPSATSGEQALPEMGNDYQTPPWEERKENDWKVNCESAKQVPLAKLAKPLPEPVSTIKSRNNKKRKSKNNDIYPKSSGNLLHPLRRSVAQD